MILLVAEKPSVANQHYRPMLERIEGEKFTQGDGCLIGKNHCITWCVGHLITLAPLDAQRVRSVLPVLAEMGFDVEDFGGADQVYVERGGQRLLYSDLVKEVE